MDSKKKILLISNAFPPDGGSGSLRIIKLIKYLSVKEKLDIEIVKPFYTEHNSQYNHLLDEIPNGVKIYNLGNKFLYKFYSTFSKRNIYSKESDKNKKSNKNIFYNIFYIIKIFLIKIISYFIIFDKYLILLIPFIKYILKIKKKPDIIIASTPSVTILLFGIIAKIFTNSKLILDFRDGWIIRPNKRRKIFVLEFIEYLLEKVFVKYADSIITVTIPLVKYFRNIKHKNVYYIPNGYDPDDFVNYKNINNSKDMQFSNKIKIIYMGGLPIHRPLTMLLNVIKNEKLIREKIKIDIWGGINPNYIKLIQKYNIESIIEYRGVFPHDKVSNIIEMYDWALLIGETGKGGETNLSGKIFEYIAMEKPIIGLVPTSAASELIMKYNIGMCANPENYKEIESLFLSIIYKKVNINYDSFKKLKNRYDRRKLAEKYYKIIMGNIK